MVILDQRGCSVSCSLYRLSEASDEDGYRATLEVQGAVPFLSCYPSRSSENISRQVLIRGQTGQALVDISRIDGDAHPVQVGGIE